LLAPLAMSRVVRKGVAFSSRPPSRWRSRKRWQLAAQTISATVPSRHSRWLGSDRPDASIFGAASVRAVSLASHCPGIHGYIELAFGLHRGGNNVCGSGFLRGWCFSGMRTIAANRWGCCPVDAFRIYLGSFDGMNSERCGDTSESAWRSGLFWNSLECRWECGQARR
jgi:hypothetical protein